jgi:hypothetical protein
MSTPVDSYVKAAAVVPSDSAVLNCEGFYVGAAGNVAVVPRDGSAPVTLTGCLAGTVYRIACSRIMATDTTASGIVALS